MNLRTIALVGTLFGAGTIAGYAVAQQADETGNIAVKVNGHSITAAEVALAADDILPQIAEISPKLRYAFIVEYLVERHLMAQEAVREKMIDSKEYKKRIRFYQAKSLRDAYFAEKIIPKITPEMVKKIYDEQAAKVVPEPRARARHIVVGTEVEAKEIAGRVAKGEKFEDLAKKYSLEEGTKAVGGDIGFFTAAEMVEDFSKAVFALKPGEVSKPVKTEQGWHIIKLEAIRPGGPVPFERVKGQIRLVLFRREVQKKVRDLRQSGKIEIIDPELIKLQDQVEEQRKKLEEKQLQEGIGKSDKNDKQN